RARGCTIGPSRQGEKSFGSGRSGLRLRTQHRESSSPHLSFQMVPPRSHTPHVPLHTGNSDAPFGKGRLSRCSQDDSIAGVWSLWLVAELFQWSTYGLQHGLQGLEGQEKICP